MFLVVLQVKTLVATLDVLENFCARQRKNFYNIVKDNLKLPERKTEI